MLKFIKLVFPSGARSRSWKKHLWFALIVALIASVLLLLSRRVEKHLVRIETIDVSDTSHIVSVEDSIVAPVVYKNITGLDEIDMEARKRKFIHAILPSILIVRHKLRYELQKVMEIESAWVAGNPIAGEDSAFLQLKMEEFNADSIADLKIKLTPHPTSIALAQAVLESGWGTSRIFEQANNVFGIWSFDAKEQRLRAASSRGGVPVYVRSYDTILESVHDYFRVLGKARAYTEFRQRRSNTENVFDLIWYLKKYSEKRTQYVVLLRNVIVANDLPRYDAYTLDRDYFTYSADDTYAAYAFVENEH